MTFDSQQQKAAFVAAVADNAELLRAAQEGKVVEPWVPEHQSSGGIASIQTITETDTHHDSATNF